MTKKLQRRLMMLSAAVGGALVADQLFMETQTAYGGSSKYWQVGAGDYATNANWNGNVPGSGNDGWIGNNGTATLSSGTQAPRDLNIGHNQSNDPGAGTLTINGGILNPSRTVNIGNGNAGTLNVSSGIFTVASGGSLNLYNATINVSGTGNLTINGAMSNTTGTSSLNVSGGTLDMGSGGTVAVDNFSFTGGTIVDVASATITSLSGSGAYTGSGTLTLSLSSASSTFGGTISGATGVTKSDSNTLTFNGNNNYTGATAINGGTLYINGATSGQGNFSFGTLAAPATLGGSGTIGLASGKTVTVTGTSSTNRAVLAPGSSSTPATFTIGTAGNNDTVTLGAYSTLDIDINAGSADRLTVNGTLNTNNGSNQLSLHFVSPNAGQYVLASATSLTSGSDATKGGFASVTGLDSAYRLNVASNQILAIHKATIGTITATPTYSTIITGGSTPFTFTVGNSAPSSSDNLNFTVAAGTNTTGTFGGTTTVAAQATSSSISGLSFNGAALGSQTGSFTVTDPNTTNAGGTLSGSVAVTVVGHSNAALAIASGNSQTIIAGGSLNAVTLNLTNAGSGRSALDVNTLNNLSGGTGTAVVASGGTGTYTATGFNTTTVGQNKSLAVSLYAGDQQSLAGHYGLSQWSQNINYSVQDHASVGSFTGGTITLADVIVGYTNPVSGANSLSVVNGSNGDYRANLKATGGSQNLVTVSGFGNVAAGGTGSLAASLAAGRGVGAINEILNVTFADDSALSGASANLATNGVTVTGKVLDHANATSSVTSGNSFIVLAGTKNLSASVNLNAQATNGSGQARAQVQVASLSSNLSGSTGLLSAGDHAYAVSFDAAGTGGLQNVAYAINAGDNQSQAGHSGTTAYNFGGSVSGTVLDAASITATSNASPLVAGNAISFTNASGIYRAAAKVTSLSVSGTGFSINGLSSGNFAAAGGSLSGTVAFLSPSNLLNGTKLTGTASVQLTNAQANGSALTGATAGDVGTYNYSLAATVSGNVAGYGVAQTASLAAGDSLAGLSSTTGHNTATILSGSTSKTGTLSETWRAKTGNDTRVFGDVIDLNMSNLTVSKYVLQMTYNETDLGGRSESSLTLGFLENGVWTKAASGTKYAEVYNPTTTYQVGDWGIDTTNNTVWAVLNHNGDGGIITIADPPYTLGIAAASNRIMAGTSTNVTTTLTNTNIDGADTISYSGLGATPSANLTGAATSGSALAGGSSANTVQSFTAAAGSYTLTATGTVTGDNGTIASLSGSAGQTTITVFNPIEQVASSSYNAFASGDNKVVVSGSKGNYVFATATATAANAGGTSQAFVNVQTPSDFTKPEYVLLALNGVSGLNSLTAEHVASAINNAGLSEVTAYFNGQNDEITKMLANWSGYSAYKGTDIGDFDVLVKFDSFDSAKSVLAFDFSQVDGGVGVTAIGVVPEPTSLGLMALPALGLLARRRRVAKK